MLEIALLAPFILTRDGQPRKLPSRRTEALVVYLLRNHRVDLTALEAMLAVSRIEIDIGPTSHLPWATLVYR